MIWQDLEQRLEGALAPHSPRAGGSETVALDVPFPLACALGEQLTSDEREELGDVEHDPGSFFAALEHLGIARRPLLDVYWDGFGPVSWDAGVDLIGNGRRYLCYWADDVPCCAVARVDAGRPGEVEAAVVRLLSRNGADLGLALFGSLPTETFNRAPTLVSRSALKRAYFDLMEWLEQEQGSAWIGLADEHFGRIAEPNHLQRCLDLFDMFSAASGLDAVQEMLERRTAESAAMPYAVRRRLFDEWFELGYTRRAEGGDA